MTFFFLASLSIYAQSISSISYNANSIKKTELSDSLAMSEYYYTQGMKLYKREKFKESISCFEKAYSLDSLLYIDSRPQILTYISMWIGNAKRRAGIKVEQTYTPEHIYQYCTPIDYHLTKDIDSISNLAKKHFDYAMYYPYAKNKIQHLKKCVSLMTTRGELLDSIVGRNHIWTANNNLMLSYYCFEISRFYYQNVFYELIDFGSPYFKFYNYATQCMKKYEDIAKLEYAKDPYSQIYYLNEMRDILLYGNCYQHSNTHLPYFVNHDYVFKVDGQLLPLIKKYEGDDNYLLADLYASQADSLSYERLDRELSASDVSRSELYSSKSVFYAKKLYDESPDRQSEMFLMQKKSDVAHNLKSLYQTHYFRKNVFSVEDRKEKIDSALNIRYELSSYYKRIGSDSLAMENQFEIARLLEEYPDQMPQLNLDRFGEVWSPKRFGDSTLPEDVIDDLNDFNTNHSLSSLLISSNNKKPQMGDSLMHVSTKLRLEQEHNIDRFFKKDTLEYYRRISDLIAYVRIHNRDEAQRLRRKLYDYACKYSDVSLQITVLGEWAIDYWWYKEYRLAADLFAKVCDQSIQHGMGSIPYYASSAADNYISFVENNKDSLLVNAQELYKKAAKYYSIAAKHAESEQSTWIEDKLKEEYSLLHAGDTCKAAQIWADAITKRLDTGRKSLMFLVPKDRDHIWNMRYRSAVDDCTRKAVKYSSSGYYADMAYNAQLFSKGAMLIYDSRFLKIKELVDSTEYQNYLTKTNDSEEYTKSLGMTWQDVQEAMHVDDIAVEFVQYVDNHYIMDINYGDASPLRNEIYDLLDKPNIGALILKKNGVPHFVHICNRDSLQSVLKNTPNDDYSNSLVYNTVWNKIEMEAKGCKNIFFSPVGLFHTLAIESLLDENGNTIGDKFNVYRLTSTRSIVSRDEEKVNLYSLFGGLKYDLTENEWMETNDFNAGERGGDMEISSLDRQAFFGLQNLPGSLTEVNSIADILRKQNKEVHLRTNQFGSEESLVDECHKSTNVLHLSTHGFCDVEKNDKSAMDKCGLFMSGASYALNNGCAIEGHRDGILLAREISELDLHSVNLVVLAACQTGLGNVTPDGVFGLQRGFKLGGAKSIVMSLWKVDDNATCKLMIEFYSNWISKKMTKHQAFEAAKKAIRETKGWEDPKYWAAFVLLDAID